MNDLQISLSTLFSAAKLIGLHWDDRQAIRDGQEADLIQALQSASDRPLTHPDQKSLFFYGALDFLISSHPQGGHPQFHPIELNGLNMGGITNMGEGAIHTLLRELAEIPGYCALEQPGVFLIPFSGSETVKNSGMPGLLYERLLKADALKQGFEALTGRPCPIVTHLDLASRPLDPGPVIVLGYVKELFNQITWAENHFSLWGRPVLGTLHDTFCGNLLQKLPADATAGDLPGLFAANRIYAITSDKGRFYQVVNRYLASSGESFSAPPIIAQHTWSEAELTEAVFSHLEARRDIVIKPFASGLGRGIEFFVHQEPEAVVREKIRRSIAETENRYGAQGGGFPYTICEFIEGRTLQAAPHPFHGHRYELRVMVYRDDTTLKAFPSIVKFAGKPYDKAQADRLMLLNNVSVHTGPDEPSHILPLTNTATLQLLGLSPAFLEELCRFSTGVVQFALNDYATDASTCSTSSFSLNPVS